MNLHVRLQFAVPVCLIVAVIALHGQTPLAPSQPPPESLPTEPGIPGFPEPFGEIPAMPEVPLLPDLTLPPEAIELPPPVSPPPAKQAEFVLPPPDTILPPTAVPLAEMKITRVEFRGNTVVATTDLEQLCADFPNRSLLQEDLDELRFDVTRLYVARGFINSGAIIPDQDLSGGVLRIQVVEGHLNEAIIRHFRDDGQGKRRDMTDGKHALATNYLRGRILLGNGEPLHFPTLQQRLQVLQTNPNLLRINAELKPGALPGEALLVMEVTENQAPRWNYGLDIHNQRAPSVGGEQAEVWVENQNFTGYSDPLMLRLGLLTGEQGDPEFDPGQTAFARYSRPIAPDDTTLELTAERQDYTVIEETFAPLNIEGESWILGAAIRRPLIRSFHERRRSNANSSAESESREALTRTVQDEVWLSFGIDHSHSQTDLLGEPFSISPGYVDGELDLSVLRFGQEWTRRTDDSILALNSKFSIGLDGLDSTDSPAEPDASFVAWTSTGQYSRRILERGDTVSLRGGFQWSDDPMPPPEQWILGGRYTVRGYRENSLVRDMGWFASVEYSFPLLQQGVDSSWSLSAIPFVDYGMGWNETVADRSEILSIGAGLRAEYSDWFRGEIFWGTPLMDRDYATGDDLQDYGIHFRCSFSRF